MRNKLTIAIFLVLVFGLTAASLLKKPVEFSENENRYLAQMPEFSLDSLFSSDEDKKFTSLYETFITDQFVMRDQWIRLKTYTERATFKQDIKNVFFCSDDYLIENYPAGDFTSQTAANNISVLGQFVEQYQEKLGENGVRVMITPTASQILKDKLPPFAYPYDQQAFLDSVRSAVGENVYLDAAATLSGHKNEYIFYRTDHHWTARGAFYAYQLWADSLGLEPWQEKDFNITEVSDSFLGTVYSKVNFPNKADSILCYQPESAKMNYRLTAFNGTSRDSLYVPSALEGKDKYTFYTGQNDPLISIQSSGPEGTVERGRKLLIVKDSYAHSFVPFAANHFEETFMVDLRYYNQPLSQLIEEKGITDILVLYNTENFATDTSIPKMLK